MRKREGWLLLVCLAISIACGSVASAERVLLGVSHKGAENDVLASIGGKLVKSYEKVNLVVADIPDGQLSALSGKHGVRFAENDVPTRKLGGNQTITWGVEKIGAPTAWKMTRGKGVRVAVLDTGIDAANFDLRVSGGYTATGVMGDYLSEPDGHGTHVAGTIAALNNNVAMVGVAPEAELYSVKVLGDTGSGSVSALIDGIMWAMQNDMQVLNISLAAAKDSAALREVCQAAYNAGLLIVAAAGNSGKANGNQNTVQYPAAYPGVIAVGAVDQSDMRASFSATGPMLDLVAPGVDIVSLLPGDQKGTGSGTSMAAPHVSGAAALVWAAHPTWSNAQVQERLFATAKSVGDGDPDWYGQGRVDVASALGTHSSPAQPGVSLSSSISVSTKSAGINQFETIAVTVRDSSTMAVVSGATVNLTVYTPAGRSFTTPGYTDASGTAQFRLKTRKQDGTGAYSLKVHASKSGYVDGITSVTNAFTVK